MPKITALIHTRNDALRLGRALESLRPCDEVLVVDDASDDDTVKVAHQYGAYVKTAIPGVTPGAYAMDAAYDWVLCIEPNEALSEGLEASLIEWKDQEHPETLACCRITVREENQDGWQNRNPEVRLINRRLVNWRDKLPDEQPCDITLTGELLRFHHP